MRRLARIICLSFFLLGIGWQTAAAAEDDSAEEPVLPAGFAAPESFEQAKILKYAWYGRLADFADVYAEPSLSAEIVRNVGDGYLFSTLVSEIESEGHQWYQINTNEYVLAENVTISQPSDFQGVQVTEQPKNSFGWIVSGHVRPSLEPGGEPHPEHDRMFRYDFIEVLEAVQVKSEDETWIWYRVDDDKWVRQTEVSLVDVTPAHVDIPDDAFWVEIDLYEQTVAAYEGDRLVYATLVSSGLNRWPTGEGLFQVSDRFESVKRSGAEGKIDYYFIEEVPYTMFFDMKTEIALHGAYWHDNFGYKASHGCVNLPPQDSEWLFFWSEGYDDDLWVYVHTSDPRRIFMPPVEELLELNKNAIRRLMQ